MEQTTQAVGMVGRLFQRYPKNIKLITFKNISKNVISSLSHIHFPKGRKWIAEDIIAVLVYSWIRAVSIHHACENLNVWAMHKNSELS